MSRKVSALLASAALAGLAACAQAQVTVDGVVSLGEYSTTLALQTTKTAWGNNFNEINAAYGNYDSTTGVFELAITGNIENGNRLILFLDSRSGGGIADTVPGAFNRFGSVGGQATDDWGTDTDGSEDVSPTPGGGSIVPAGFNPNYSIEINHWPPNNEYYIDIIDLTLPNEPHPNRHVFLGSNEPGAGAVAQFYMRDSGLTFAGEITHAFNNSNTEGVVGLSDPDEPEPWPQGDPTSATTGLEFSFDSTFINREPGKALRMFIALSSGGGDWLSNQFLPGITWVDGGDLGGPGGWGGEPLFDARTFPNSANMMITVFEPTFTGAVNNNWSDNGNWVGNFAPNGVEHDAAFNGAGGTINLDTSVQLGTLKFDGAAGYTIETGNSSTLTFDAGSGAARIDVLAHSNVIEPEVVFASPTRINTGLADITFDGDITNTGNRIVVSGIGTVNFNGAQNHLPGSRLAIDGGTVNMAQNAGGNPTQNLEVFVSTPSGGDATLNSDSSQHLAHLQINPGGKVNFLANGDNALFTKSLVIATDEEDDPLGRLDLADNDLVVDYTGTSPFNDLQAMVLAGYSGTVDAGKAGIVSSTSQAQGGDTILALVDNAAVGGFFTSWLGQPVDFDTVIGKYTYFGDANLDGQVTGDDFALAVSNLGMTGALWIDGDMNFTGTVTGDDLTIIIANLGKGVGNPLGSSLSGSAVPEPTGAALLALASTLLLRRRRTQA